MNSRLPDVRSRRRAGLVCALAAFVAWVAVGEAQKKGGGKPTPSLQGVSAVFGTNVDMAAPWPGCESLPPGLSGDGSVYGFDASTQTGAYLWPEFALKMVGAGPPFVYLNFSSLAYGYGPATPSLPEDFCDVVLSEFSFDTHMLLPNGDDDIYLGLYDVQPGETRPTRIKAFFDYVDRGGNPRTYTIRFNPAGYPGSTNVAITRGPADDPAGPVGNWSIASNQWVIQTGPYAVGSGDVAQLVSPTLTKKGHPGPNDEGFYNLPFKMTITLP